MKAVVEDVILPWNFCRNSRLKRVNVGQNSGRGKALTLGEAAWQEMEETGPPMSVGIHCLLFQCCEGANHWALSVQAGPHQWNEHCVLGLQAMSDSPGGQAAPKCAVIDQGYTRQGRQSENASGWNDIEAEMWRASAETLSSRTLPLCRCTWSKVHMWWKKPGA
jgi:hypothetical protein